MSYEFDVFVSYARADGAAFARDLVRQLDAAGFSCYLDEEQMAPGDDVLESLVRALRRSRHAVFVITAAWLKKDWTRWEGDVFVEEGKDRRLVPILRAQGVGKADLGPYLSKVDWLDWPPQADADAQFWQVYCGLCARAPGPREQWAACGRQAQGKGALAGGAPSPEAPREEVLSAFTIQIELPAALGLDRAPQWGELCTYAATTRSEALFVVGPRRYGHDAFLRRVQQCLGRAPERHIKVVAWNPPWTPVGRDAFLKPLADAFDVRTEGQLVAALRAMLLDTNLVLVHQPVVEDSFETEDLVLYYTRWLPELVGRVDPEARADDRIFGIKALQSVAWWPEGESRRAGTSEREARALLDRLRTDQDRTRLPVRVLTPLDPITREHVERWSEDHLPAGVDCRRFVERVMDGARDPAEILDRIVQWFGQDRREQP